MFKRLKHLTKQPKKRLTRRTLQRYLGIQFAVLLVVLIVVEFFPDRAATLGILVFFALAISFVLLEEVAAGRLGEPNAESNLAPDER